MKALAILPLLVLFMAAVYLPPLKDVFLKAQDRWDGIEQEREKEATYGNART